MRLADLAPRSPLASPVLWIAIAVLVVAVILVRAVMRPLAGWKRFALRHGLQLEGDRMAGTVSGRAVEVVLVRNGGAPKTRMTVGGQVVEVIGRMDEATLEAHLAMGLGRESG